MEDLYRAGPVQGDPEPDGGTVDNRYDNLRLLKKNIIDLSLMEDHLFVAQQLCSDKLLACSDTVRE